MRCESLGECVDCEVRPSKLGECVDCEVRPSKLGGVRGLCGVHRLRGVCLASRIAVHDSCIRFKVLARNKRVNPCTTRHEPNGICVQSCTQLYRIAYCRSQVRSP